MYKHMLCVLLCLSHIIRFWYRNITSSFDDEDEEASSMIYSWRHCGVHYWCICNGRLCLKQKKLSNRKAAFYHHLIYSYGIIWNMINEWHRYMAKACNEVKNILSYGNKLNPNDKTCTQYSKSTQSKQHYESWSDVCFSRTYFLMGNMLQCLVQDGQ